MRDKTNYYSQDMPNKNFSIDIGLSKSWEYGYSFREHWHEHLQIFYIVSGQGYIRCAAKAYNVIPKDIVIVNSREMHYLESRKDNFKFYLIRIDLPFLFSNQIDLCQTKYLAPLSENLILFKNLIRDNLDIISCVETIIYEYNSQEIGYELAIKSSLYSLMVLLMRNCVDRFVTPKQLTHKINTAKRFREIFDYIENNYSREISSSDLAEIAHVSTYYFCRIFKQITGQTPTEYITELRIRKSIDLLKADTLSITQIAMQCGFNDINYFSRVFKRRYGISPSKFQY